MNKAARQDHAVFVRCGYNPRMSFMHIDMESAMRRVADRRIEEAMRQGKFDNLPGFGKPLELEPIPADEKARLTWWALKLLRQNDIIPEEVAWRKTIDQLRERLAQARDEASVRNAVAQINALARRINTLGTNALPGTIVPLLEAAELQKFRLRKSSALPRAVAE